MTASELPTRRALAHLTTPIERLPRLSKRAGAELSVKRDDGWRPQETAGTLTLQGTSANILTAQC